MTKVLIGGRNVQTDLNDFPFLQDNTEFQIITSNSGKDLLNKCRTLTPNIIILDSNIKDMAYTDLMDRISALPYENNKCNLILSVNKPEDKLLLKNTSVLYEILDQPVNITEARNAVDIIKSKYSIPLVTSDELEDIISRLGINLYSLGCQCLISAIFRVYYHPDDFSTLNNIYEKIKPQFDSFKLTAGDIKNKVRHTIDTLNVSTTIEGQELYHSIFGDIKNPSAKIFVQKMSQYLKTIKSKK